MTAHAPFDDELLEPMEPSAATGKVEMPDDLLAGALDGAALAMPVEAGQWLVKGLEWAPGRPAMIGGYNGSGKTTLAMAAGLDLLADRPVWGWFQGRPVRRVVHLNFDQGANGTIVKYQALAKGHGIDLAALGERIRVVNSPRIDLTHPNAYDLLARALDGVDVAIFDAFRGAIGGADETTSDFRVYIDLLRSVSDVTGCTPLVPVHSKKKGSGPQADPREMLRGSSAIMDAAGSVLHVEGRGADPRLVSHLRQHEAALGEPQEDFYVVLVRDTPDALRVEYRTRQQVKPPAKESSKFDQLKDSIVRVVREAGTLRSCNAICSRVKGGTKTDKLQAINELLDEGKLAKSGKTIHAV